MRIDSYKGQDGGVPAARTEADPHPETPTLEQVNAAVMSFTLLAGPTRVRMLWSLRDQTLDVASLANAECRPTLASQHFSKLRFAGLVEATRDGRRMLYQVRSGHVRELLIEALFPADHRGTGSPLTDDRPIP